MSRIVGTNVKSLSFWVLSKIAKYTFEVKMDISCNPPLFTNLVFYKAHAPVSGHLWKYSKFKNFEFLSLTANVISRKVQIDFKIIQIIESQICKYLPGQWLKLTIQQRPKILSCWFAELGQKSELDKQFLNFIYRYFCAIFIVCSFYIHCNYLNCICY